MKVKVVINRYPNNYVEEALPQVIIEVRFKNDGVFNRRKASMLAEDIKNFITGRTTAHSGKVDSTTEQKGN